MTDEKIPFLDLIEPSPPVACTEDSNNLDNGVLEEAKNSLDDALKRGPLFSPPSSTPFMDSSVPLQPTDGAEDVNRVEDLNEPDLTDTTALNSEISITNSFSNPQMTCYCGQPRDYARVEIQCCVCCKYFHLQCVSVETGPLLPFTTSYQFFCLTCSPNNQELFHQKPASFVQLCMSALANLTLQRGARIAGKPDFFSKDKDIIPFIEANWESLTSASRRVRSTWHASVAKALLRDDAFISSCSGDGMFALRHPNLESIGPVNESLRLLLAPNRILESGHTRSHAESTTRKGSKRKLTDSSSNQSRKRGDVTKIDKMIPHCYPNEHPYNKDGYRYHLAEPDPHSPYRQKLDDCELLAGKPIPGHLHRVYLEKKAALSLCDRAPQLHISDDRLTVTGEKGYSLVRGINGVSEGTWFFEVKVLSMDGNSASRIGWSMSLGNVQAPCGYDKFSYSWRSRKGTVFHDSRGTHFSDGYGQNDVLGLLIYFPRSFTADSIPKAYKFLPLVKFKNHLYFEEKDDIQRTEANLVPDIGSKIAFYKNGVFQGIAFKDIYAGTYYPALSLYKSATLTINFGPDFTYKLPTEDFPDVRPMSDAVTINIVKHELGDILFHICEDVSSTFT